MKQISCNHCGESVYLADRGEHLEGYETPLEHMEKTGHSPKSPVMYQCDDCGNVWGYTGDGSRPTCSNCRGKNTSPADADSDEQATEAEQ